MMNPGCSLMCRLVSCPADFSGLTMGAIAKPGRGVNWKIAINFCRVNGAERSNVLRIVVTHGAGPAPAIKARWWRRLLDQAKGGLRLTQSNWQVDSGEQPLGEQEPGFPNQAVPSPGERRRFCPAGNANRKESLA